MVSDAASPLVRVTDPKPVRFYYALTRVSSGHASVLRAFRHAAAGAAAALDTDPDRPHRLLSACLPYPACVTDPAPRDDDSVEHPSRGWPDEVQARCRQVALENPRRSNGGPHRRHGECTVSCTPLHRFRYTPGGALSRIRVTRGPRVSPPGLFCAVPLRKLAPAPGAASVPTPRTRRIRASTLVGEVHRFMCIRHVTAEVTPRQLPETTRHPCRGARRESVASFLLAPEPSCAPVFALCAPRHSPEESQCDPLFAPCSRWPPS